MADRKFGDLVKERREATIDSTGHKMTQAELAEAINQAVSDKPIGRTWVLELEQNRIALPAAGYVNAICKILAIDGAEAVRSLGFDVGFEAMRPDERDLLAAYRRLRPSPILQETILEVAQTASRRLPR